MIWITPDGREIRVGEFAVSSNTSFRFNQDDRLQRRLERETGIDGVSVVHGLFDDPAQEGLQVLPGTYRLDSIGLLFEPESELDLAFVSYGEVHGVAGTDHQRRDLSVALLWGTPIALSLIHILPNSPLICHLFDMQPDGNYNVVYSFKRSIISMRLNIVNDNDGIAR